MKKLSFKVAFCGISTALCVVVMFCSAVIPLLIYVMPVVASVLILFIKEELGSKWAWLSFFSTALLSLLIIPDLEVKTIFITTLGWYPLVQECLLKIKPKLLSFLTRISVLNATVAVCYFLLIKIFNMTELLDTGGQSVKAFLITILIMAEIFFVIYDLLLSKLVIYYNKVISKKLRRLIK